MTGVTGIARADPFGQPDRLFTKFVEEAQGIGSLEHFDLEHLPDAGLTSYRSRERLMDIGDELEKLPAVGPAYTTPLAGSVSTPVVAARQRQVRVGAIYGQGGRSGRRPYTLKIGGCPVDLNYPKPMHLQPTSISCGKCEGSLLVSERL